MTTPSHPPADRDPILSALAEGDQDCPDGRALAALGALVRGVSPARSDLTARIAHAIADAAAQERRHSADDAAQEDALADAEAASAALRLQSLVREATALPRPVDLAAKVRARLRRSSRFPALAGDGAGRSRLRVWHAVLAGHLAALLVFTIIRLDPVGGSGDGAGSGHTSTTQHSGLAKATIPGLPDPLPSSWADMRAKGHDLLLLRRDPQVREAARAAYGQAQSQPVVAAGIAWLLRQQTADGAFSDAPPENDDRALATHALALLALAGEGLGDSALTAALRHGLARLSSACELRPQPGTVAGGIAALALIDGGLLLGDRGAAGAGELILARLARGPEPQAGATGLEGFLALAVATARQGGLPVPDTLADPIDALAQPPPADAQASRTGLAIFLTRIAGGRHPAALANAAERLTASRVGLDRAGRADPLGWYFQSLGLREQGGPAWDQWSADVRKALLQIFTHDADGTAYVPADKVAHSTSAHNAANPTGAVFATSLSLLNLQVAYRYLPLE